ncbi:MAG: HAD-IB family hydrolase [Proteobacteria bacterium]|nr:HAD-IB family hydrolase [Pseudomonadota bacterium]
MKLALFDLDGTLLPIDSDHAFGEFLIELGWADAAEYRRRNDAFYEQYKAERLDIDAYVDFCTAPWRDRPAPELAAAQARFIDERARPALHERALALVQRHREAGDRLAVVTATNDFITRPIAALFGIETLIATELQRDAAGRATGAISGTPAFRAGKVQRVHDWLRGQGADWADFEAQVFYSDSINDLALLEHVSHPVATNPGPALEAVARQRAWPILRLFE